MLIYMLLPNESVVYFGKEYDEAEFQAALEQKYAEYFVHDETYEDNIMLYVLVEEAGEQIYYIAKVGGNINNDIYYMFGGNDSPLGNAIWYNVEEYYTYSLDKNLAAVVDDMKAAVVGLSLESSFVTKTAPASPSESKLVDLTYAGLPNLSEKTVNTALSSFTEETGIRMVVVVDYIDNVFTKSGSGGATAFLVIGIGVLVAVIAYTSYSNNKNRKKKNED